MTMTSYHRYKPYTSTNHHVSAILSINDSSCSGDRAAKIDSVNKMASQLDNLQQSPEEDIGNVVSLSWEKGKVAAAYYNLSSFELFVSHETLDYSPEFAITMNLLRQVKPLYIVASGPNYFLKEILVFLNLPSENDLGQYRVKNLCMNSLLPLIVYPQNEKNLITNRRKILEINLPGIPNGFSTEERKTYIESIFPLYQHLVVHCLGTLLEYLNANRSHLFLGSGSDLTISDVKVYSLQSEVPIDDLTINSLQIFSDADHHPSGYKKGENQASKEGFSVFRLVDRCFSRLGSKTMKMILSHPLRCTNELTTRYETIDWFLGSQKSEKIQVVKKYLKNIGDISLVFRNIVLQPEKIKNWHLFKKIVYNAYMVMKGCKDIGIEAAPNTLFAELAQAIEDDEYILQVLHVLDRVVDLDKGLTHSKFSVQMGLDADLDEKKLLMISLQDSIQEAVQNEFRDLSNSTAGEVCCYYIPEVGYVIKVQSENCETSLVDQLNQNLTLVSRSDDAFYYHNALCDELNKKYGSLYSEIREHESRICRRLVTFLKERLVGIQQIVKLCAQLDCILSFAQVADQMSLKKPQLVTEKIMNIQKGRHVLWELKQRMIPNDFSSSNNQKLVTLLSAPNSSGKSVYLKQIALTAFLAHVGSYVPATSAQISLLDSIYSRINCPESVYGNNSSFLNDVRQLGKVMTNSTDRSLILIDEFGKGTSLLEAQALLASCIEDLIQRGDKCPITLISTHYADIYDIVQDKDKDSIAMKTFENISNKNGEMISTFQLKDGRSLKKYATKVASVKKFMDELDKKSTNDVKRILEIKVRLAVFMIWLRLHGETVDYKKIIEEAIV